MKGIRYILTLLTLCVAVVSCERGDSLSDVVQESGRPIEFSVESDWPEITKALISNSDDIKGVGFKVWGVQSSDSDGSNSESVFGEDGTSVSFTDGKWKSDVVKDWEGGYYSFASVLHPAKFAGTYSNNTLSIDLGDNGYNLAVNQDDFMVAFQNVDNSGYEASVVNLEFDHVFALLDIRIATTGAPFASMSIYDAKIALYGIHRKIDGNLTITQSNDGKIITNLNSIVAEKTTSESAYYSRPYTGSLNTETNTFSFFPDKLLVFPEDLTKSQLTIEIVLKGSGNETVITRTINEGEWLPGSTNVYLIRI